MQQEVDTLTTVRPIELLGINLIGSEGGNATICTGRSVPWLQDTPQAKVWETWRATHRDVIVLDAENKVIQVYNLTDHDLSNPTNYATLRDRLLAAAR